jgi:eukaryotic-like serine/threonine-protein kinase
VTPSSIQPLKDGQSLKNGKYTIEKFLGQGRFGITYLAKRADGEKRVIKILNPAVLETLTDVERKRLEDLFWQEAVKLAKCNGTPHIAQVDEPFTEGNFTCLPIEHMDGSNLADRSQRILPEERALEYIYQIGKALSIVHKNQLVHCDIRPKNIFVRIIDGQVVLVLANFRMTRDFNSKLSQKRPEERVEGFSPLELYDVNQEVGAYTDVYSLAATLYELLTGEVPAGAIDISSGLKELISPQTRNHKISSKTNKAILDGMAVKREKRPQTIEDWLDKFNIKTTPTKKKETSVNLQTVWMAMTAIITLLVGIPSWLTWMKQNSSTTPSPISPVKVHQNQK